MAREQINQTLLIFIAIMLLFLFIQNFLIVNEIDPENIIPESEETNNILENEECYIITRNQESSANQDSDFDGYLDAWEEYLGTDPDNPNEVPEDTDNDLEPDGNSNNSETWMDTDDDNDGIPDTWELDHNLDPKNATDAGIDPDEDGFSNLKEYYADTDPYDGNDYPQSPDKIEREQHDPMQFIIFLFIFIIIVMLISAIIGKLVIDKRKVEDEFWDQTFGNDRSSPELRPSVDGKFHSRDKYEAWVRGIEKNGRGRIRPKQKYKLEVIGGPDDTDELEDPYKSDIRSKKSSKKKVGIAGKTCLWCDNGITGKFVKRCPGRRTATRRCPDGPFCSKKCLNEHLVTVPHFEEADF